MQGTTVALACITLLASTGLAVDLNWSQLSTTNTPTRRSRFAAGFSRNLNRIVVHGGKGDSDTAESETWILDLGTMAWSEVTTSTVIPPGRFTHVGGVHEATDRFIIATGEGTTTGSRVFHNDVWALDLNTLQWSELVPATEGRPKGRYGGGGGINPWGGDRIIVTHGFTGSGFDSQRFDDTWAFDLNTNTWTNMSPDQRAPFKRCLIAGAVTQAEHVAMFGGCGSGGHGPCAAWDAWSLQNNRWGETDTCIEPRLYPAMASAGGNLGGGNAVLVFGGRSMWGEGSSGDAHLWDLTTDTWTALEVSGASGVPSTRWGSGMVTGTAGSAPSATDVVYVIGGETIDTLEVWQLAGDEITGVPTKSCPFVFRIRIFHGVMMFLAWGLLLPLGVTVARFYRGRESTVCGKRFWFGLHRILNSLGWVFSLGGIVSAFFVNEAGKFSTAHAIIGGLVFLIGFQQPINAFFRPEPPQNKTRRRVCWEVFHKYGGRTAIFLGLLNPFFGLFFVDTRRRASGWAFILYSIWVFALVVFWVVMTFRGRPGPENPSPIANAAYKLVGGTPHTAAEKPPTSSAAAPAPADTEPSAA